jgi:hypothetical protein
VAAVTLSLERLGSLMTLSEKFTFLGIRWMCYVIISLSLDKNTSASSLLYYYSIFQMLPSLKETESAGFLRGCF